MAKYLLTTYLLLLSLFVRAQVSIVQWNFNNNDSTPNIGTGKFSRIGGVTGSYVLGTGSSDVASINRAYSSASYPAASSNNKSAGVKIQVSTVGYQSIQLLFDNKNSGTAANTMVVKYSLDDITYTELPGAIYTSTNTNYYKSRLADFSAITSLNNAAVVYFEIVTAFVGASYQPTNIAGTYNPVGTIHFDMITVKGITTTCTGSPTFQAKNMRLTKTDATSMTMDFNRGNGGGCIVIARQGSAVNAAPANGTAYVADNIFGVGTQIGTGNFVVHNTTTQGSQQFTMTGLTEGATYYFDVYEYSQTGFCYFTPSLSFSAVCNSTVLTPGDMLIMGFDALVSTGGVDKYLILNLVDIKKGTSFNLVNSRFEAGASANTRTNFWRGSGASAFADPSLATLTYTGSTPLSKGSVISFELNSSVANVKVNGIPNFNFTSTVSNIISGGMVSVGSPDQIFLTTGFYTPYGTAGIDRYNLLTGTVLCGLTNSIPWVPFSASVSGSSVRESRIPAQISCINVDHGFSTNNFGYYKGIKTGTKAQIISAYNYSSNWALGAATDGDSTIAAEGIPFLIQPSNQNGFWTGASSTDWFDCKNWNGLAVPDSTTNVWVPISTNQPTIDAKLGALYDSLALANKLSIGSATLTLGGTGKDRIHIYDSLTLADGGTFRSISSGAGEIDTVLLNGNLRDNNMSNGTTGLKLSDKTILIFENSRINASTQVFLNASTPANPDVVYAATINNPAGINLLKGGFETSSTLNLTNGFITYGGADAFHTIGPNCIIKNPANRFGETNRGWEYSYFDGRVNVKTNSTRPYPAPIGSTTQRIYAPVIIEPASTSLKTYYTSYIPMAHPNVSPSDVEGFDHVSQLEYWKVFSTDNAYDAKLTLYYTPHSQVGDGFATNDATNMQDLRLAQYYNDANGYKWKLFGSTPFVTYSLIPGSTVNNGAIHYSQFATNFAFDAQYFTLASLNNLSTLPVHFVKFEAGLQNNKVKIGWQVTDDGDASSYTVEKSIDGKKFSTMQKLYARQQPGIADYVLYDSMPEKGWNFYRLIVTNRQNKSFTYQIKKVYIHKTERIAIYPNPASDVLYLSSPSAFGQIELLDVTGKRFLLIKVTQTYMKIPVGYLPRGLYSLVYRGVDTKQTQKVILQ